MKGLTIYQPDCSLLATGVRRVETRSWGTSYRGLLAIHAAKRWDEDVEDDCLNTRDFLEEIKWQAADPFADRLARLPVRDTLGCVLAVARLADCRLMAEPPTGDGFGPHEGRFGWFGPGRWGWVLADVVVLEKPVAWRGERGLWDCPPELVEKVKASMIHQHHQEVR